MDKDEIMNRDIKFEYGFEFSNGIVKKVYHLHEIHQIKEKCDLWNELPIKYVRQFIGLFDQTGKEIYEGDIITFHYDEDDYRGLVCLSTTYGISFKVLGQVYFINTDYQSFSKIEKDWIMSNNPYDKVVIGNIHENPELLTQP